MIMNRRMHDPRPMIGILAFSALAAMSQVSWAVSAHDYTLKKINGQALPLRKFRGRPILLVNTASRCGFTPQYKTLQALWEKYQECGLVVVGVPSNDFGRQEPGSARQIQQFCEVNYGVKSRLPPSNAWWDVRPIPCITGSCLNSGHNMRRGGIFTNI